MLVRGDARSLPLRDGCVQCVVTSPPYWGLRDYGSSHQIGLESTPDAYVNSLLAVFAEVWRVLKRDGVVWLNLGDSYAGSWGAQGRQGKDGEMVSRSVMSARQIAVAARKASRTGSVVGLDVKSKDLVGIPWRVALALQAHGWYLRADVIWHKPNPMPESVTDRPTKSHEYLFLLTKSERYYYDAKAIKELANSSGPRGGNLLNDTPKGPNGGKTRWKGERALDWGETGRNRRSVWSIATMPYSGAHFATMPEALVEPCVLAGSRFGDLVFDPFSGSGTVLAVAERLGRRAVGTDLNPAYHQLAKERTRQRGFRFEANG